MMDHEKVNILLVDDQPAKLLAYEVILKELGENLIVAASGREALPRARAARFADASLSCSRSLLNAPPERAFLRA